MRLAVIGAVGAVTFGAGICGISWATPARAGSIDDVARTIAKQLGAMPAGALVVAAPIVSDQPIDNAKKDELASRLAEITAGALAGGGAHANAQVAPLGQARAIAGKASALAFVQVEIAKGQLRAACDVYPVQSNGWDRARVPAPPPKAHAFAESAIDAEVRAYLPAIPLERAQAHVAKHDEGDVLAAACGDVNGDGGMEIALVTRQRVSLGKIVGGRYVAERAQAWSALLPRAAVPMRDPIGGASIASSRVIAGTSDRGGVALDALLAKAGVVTGIPVAGRDACASLAPEASAFEGDVRACAAAPGEKTPAVRAKAPADRYDAFADADVVTVDGKLRAIVATHDPAGKVVLKIGEATTTIEGAGAQIAVGDLDQDGEPEIVTTASEGEDAITIASWDGSSSPPRVRVKLAAPAGVRALAVCPPEERGVPAVVAVVGSEVWIVR